MTSYLTATKSYNDGSFWVTCPKCEKLNEVSVTKQVGHNEPEEYYCATCGNELGKVSASLPPVVRFVEEKASK